MAGHSKWANIKHRKARQDAVKGRAWSKCSRAIMVAVKQAGPDPDTNLTLRYAMDEARSVNMPKDTIEKAIKKASGAAGEGANYEEIRYEGYGPNGVAVIVDCLTDNVQRTAPEMRKIFEKHGGKLAKPGSVAFGFQSRGVILIEASKIDEDGLMEIALESGADDVTGDDAAWEITCEPSDFLALRTALEAAELELDSAQVTMVPEMTVDCDATEAGKVMRLMDAIEDHDDVQKVYLNADLPDDFEG